MKYKYKDKKNFSSRIMSLTIFIIFFLLLTTFYPLSTSVLAQVKLETGLPGHSTVPTETALPSYINYLFIFGLSLITILALAQMIVGGITYILAAGNVAKVEDAKDMIFQALIGLGVLLISYLLLYTINPDLINLKNPNLTPTEFRGKPFQGMEATETEKKLFPETAGKPCGPSGSVSLGGLVCQDGQWKSPTLPNPAFGP